MTAPDLIGSETLLVLCSMVPEKDIEVLIHNRRPRAQAGKERVPKNVCIVEFVRALALLLVNSGQLLISGLQLLVHGLELFIGGLESLVFLAAVTRYKA